MKDLQEKEEIRENSKNLSQYIPNRFLAIVSIFFTALALVLLVFVSVYSHNNKEKINTENIGSYTSNNNKKELLDSSTMNEYVLELNAANASVDAGEYEEAIESYKEAIEIAPKEEAAYIGLANTYKYTGDLQKANDILLKAYENTGSENLKEYMCESTVEEID